MSSMKSILIMILGSGIAAVLMWLAYSWYPDTDWDLREFDRQLHDRGFPARWQEVRGRTLASTEQQAVFAELHGMLDNYIGHHGARRWWDEASDGEWPLPDAAWLARFDELLATLPHRALVLNPLPELGDNAGFALLDIVTELGSWWEDALLQAADARHHHGRRMQHLLKLMEITSSLDGMVLLRQRTVLCQALIHQDPASLDSALIGEVLQWSIISMNMLREMMLADYLCFRQWIEAVADEIRSPLERWSRTAALNIFREQMLLSADHSSVAALIPAYQAFSDQREPGLMARGSVIAYVAGLALADLNILAAMQLRSAVLAQMVLHEWGIGPWPEDPFNPDQALPRIIGDDGQLLGSWIDIPYQDRLTIAVDPDWNGPE
ncbi:MAG: hypothetical protein EA401_00865 [Planctomycetota bacterium]|nr:MAG: hypothetical protein EA401_00865 [Planctomycetota bacterium]